jgi:hypothetical protein
MGAFAVVGIAVAAVLGFLLGQRRKPRLMEQRNASFFTTTPGSGGFCRGRVVERKMRGADFRWVRHGSCRPAEGGRFEIRPKRGYKSPLIPPVPYGVDEIVARADPDVPNGTKYEYGLFQVLPDGHEQEIDDPELEIVQY